MIFIFLEVRNALPKCPQISVLCIQRIHPHSYDAYSLLICFMFIGFFSEPAVNDQVYKEAYLKRL